jgi:hypothetical protein
MQEEGVLVKSECVLGSWNLLSHVNISMGSGHGEWTLYFNMHLQRTTYNNDLAIQTFT